MVVRQVHDATRPLRETTSEEMVALLDSLQTSLQAQANGDAAKAIQELAGDVERLKVAVLDAGDGYTRDPLVKLEANSVFLSAGIAYGKLGCEGS